VWSAAIHRLLQNPIIEQPFGMDIATECRTFHRGYHAELQADAYGTVSVDDVPCKCE